MSIRRLFLFLVVAIAFLLATGTQTTPLNSNGNTDNTAELLAGRNVNMVSGTMLPLGDPFLQRQNEPSLAVSSRNPMHLFAAANDYRTIDMPHPYEPRGIPGVAAGRDAWIGVFESFDGGESFVSMLLPGFPQDSSIEGSASPIYGFDTACDPRVCAGAEGLFYLSGIAFMRNQLAGVVFVARYVDRNNREKVEEVVDEISGERKYVGPIEYVDTWIAGVGNPGQFIDMPNMAVDVPRGDAPFGNVYLAYTVFLGNTSINVRSRVVFISSTDGGINWSKPIKLTESQHIIQRPVIAIDPSDPTGKTIYVTFRRFAHGRTPGGIAIVKSSDGGMSFTKPADIATLLCPFDQWTKGDSTITSLRTNSYPTMAVEVVDENGVPKGVPYVAWAQRYAQNGQPDPDGQSRIVFSYSLNGGLTWLDPPQLVDPYYEGDGHQFMPSTTCAGGNKTVIWYDQRDDISLHDPNTKFIEDVWLDHRHTIDVRAAEAPVGSPIFGRSILLSRYLFFMQLDETGEPIKDSETGEILLWQGEHNYSGFPLFHLGTKPFQGDYIEVTPSPQILPPPAPGSNSWAFNTDPSEPTRSHGVWTDTRDVRPPGSPGFELWGDWINYNPPTSEQDIDFEQQNPCNNKDTTGMRNQNIYTADLNHGVIVGSPGNTKQLDTQRAFVVFVKNTTENEKLLNLTIIPSAGASASFEQFPPAKSSLVVTVLPYSSVSSTVYVEENSNLFAPVIVDVDESGALVGRVYLNPDSTNNPLLGPNGEPLLGESHKPKMSNPKIWKYNVGNQDDPNASFLSPRAQNPRAQNSGYINPRAQNPRAQNPRAQNPRAQNPRAQNENIVNNEMLNPRAQNPRAQNTALTDMTWTVTNDGNTTSAYSFNIASDSPDAINAEFENDYLIAQVLVYKTHMVPIDNECDLFQTHADELIVNFTNPRAQNPRAQNVAETSSNITTLGTNSTEQNDSVEPITFYLAPGEEAEVILRVYDPDTTVGNSFDDYVNNTGGETEAEAADTGQTEPEWAEQPNVPWVNPLPAIVASPISLSFSSAGSQPLNLSLSDLSMGELDYNLSDDADWLTVTPTGGTLDDYPKVHDVTVDDLELPPGSYVGTITVFVPNASNNPLRIPVYLTSGGIGSPEIEVSWAYPEQTDDIEDGETFDFGTEYLWSSSEEATFVIENTGGIDLILGGNPIITIYGPDADEFRVVQHPTSPVVPGGDTAFSLQFAPTSGGPKTAMISIMNNDFDENPFDITLQGTCEIIPTLVAYYPFNGNANDESGTGNHGTVYGASLTTDRFNNSNSAYEFDGIDDYIEAQDSDTLDITNEITITAWVKPYINEITLPIVNKYRSAWAYRAYWLYGWTSGQPGPRFRVCTEPYEQCGDATTSDLLPTTNWSFVAGTYDGSQVKLYVDGVEKDPWDVDGVIITNSLPLRIGADNEIDVNYFDGKIDDIRIYNYALSEAEIQELSAAAAYLKVTGNTTVMAGNPKELTITAYDENDYVATGYTGLKDLIFSGPGIAPDETEPTVANGGTATPVGTVTPINFTNGVSDPVVTLIAYKAETISVDVTDGTIDSFADDTYDFDLTVDPAPFLNLKIEPIGGGYQDEIDDHIMTSGEYLDCYAVGYDGWGNYRYEVEVTWSTTGNLDDITEGPSQYVRFTPTSGPTSGTIVADHVWAPDDATGTITVDPGPPTKLAFSVQPGGATAGEVFTQQPVVEVQDQYGNTIISDDTTQVSIAIDHDPSPVATLSGTTTTTVTDGVATFSDLSIDNAGSGYTLIATSSPGYTQATSEPFNVLATITGTVMYNGESITPNHTTTTDLDFWIYKGGQYYPISAQYDNTTGIYTIPNIEPGTYKLNLYIDAAIPPDGKRFPGDFTGSEDSIQVPANQSEVVRDIDCIKYIHITDPINNLFSQGSYPPDPYDTYSSPVVFQWDAISEATRYDIYVQKYQNPPNYAYIETVLNPSISDTQISIDLPAIPSNQHYELRITAHNNTYWVGETTIVYDAAYGTDYRFRIIPVVISGNLSFVEQPSNSVGGQSISPAVQVKAEDELGAPLAGVSITMGIETNPCSGTLSGGTVVSTLGNGIATFSNLNIDKGEEGYTLEATSGGLTSVISDPFNVEGFCDTGSLLAARRGHTETLLPNGEVLITGGQDNGTFLNSAELYNPATGTFSSTGSMGTTRQYHRATLLPTGKVLITGGSVLGGNTLASAELYDPTAGTFSNTGPMGAARENHKATLLANGNVLISGGRGNPYTTLNGAELYDPSTGTFSATGNMGIPRKGHTATLLSNGEVLIAGGSYTAGLNSAELYDPDAGTFSSTGNMSIARGLHTATLLPNSKVLIIGGGTADLYDPNAGTFSSAGSMSTARQSNHKATLLPNGKVLISGGSPAPTASASAELYDPTTNSFSPTGGLGAARLLHTMTLLSSGKVLVTGGSASSSSLASAEIFYPSITVIGGLMMGWGSNNYGKLGDGTTTNTNIPMQVIDPGDPTGKLTDVVAAGAGSNHSLVLKSDGSVWAWGFNGWGSLGDGTTDDSNTAVQVIDPNDVTGKLTDVVAIAAGYNHNLALKSGGTVWAWGWNAQGQLGDDSTTNRNKPVQVIETSDPTGKLTDVVAVAADYTHSLALKSDGTVWAWGANSYGKLGDGTIDDRDTAVQVVDPNDPTGKLTDVVAIAAGQLHSLALKSDGTVWAWGYSNCSQLGHPGVIESHTPVQVLESSNPDIPFTGVKAIAAGGLHSLALKIDGTVWGWGRNENGQVGDGTTDLNISLPVQASGLTEVTAIAARYNHSLALKSDGNAWAWGYNFYGQLGDGSNTDRNTPVQVQNLTYVVAIACGTVHSMAIIKPCGVTYVTYEFVTEWGSEGTADGQFKIANGIAVDSSGDVYVVDGSNHRVQKFTSSGTFVTKWGSFGTGEGQFNGPCGIAVDSSGNVYVMDTGNHRVQKFDSDGNFQATWGSEGTADGQFKFPRGIAVDSSGDVYVMDYENHRVQTFNSSGDFLRKWGNQGTGDGEFIYPCGIAVDSSGYVYVMDTNNKRVQKFDSDGNFQATWGSSGTGNGQFNGPWGIAVDSSGYVYVTDTGNHRVQKFTSSGTFVTKWGNQGDGNGQFDGPRGIAVDSSGNVYVIDTNNYRVQKFQKSE